MKNSRLDRAMAIVYFIICYLMLIGSVSTVIISLLAQRLPGVIAGAVFTFVAVFMIGCAYAERFHEQINK